MATAAWAALKVEYGWCGGKVARYICPMLTLAFLSCLGCLNGTAMAQSTHMRPMHTFSIVAVDSATGQIGVAVQSHWFSVGGGVAWAEPGVGAVATQSFILPAY